MNIDQAKASVGKLVMSLDAGYKATYRVPVPHGPYVLLQVTKCGLVILKDREEHRIPPSLISKYKECEEYVYLLLEVENHTGIAHTHAVYKTKRSALKSSLELKRKVVTPFRAQSQGFAK